MDLDTVKNIGGARVFPFLPGAEPPNDPNAGEFTVPQLTLATIWERYGPPLPLGLVKIDIEGAEVGAFAGLAPLIKVHRPIVIAEVIEPNYAAVLKIISGWGYDVKTISIHDYIFKPAGVAW
jgi:hypothetical protein